MRQIFCRLTEADVIRINVIMKRYHKQMVASHRETEQCLARKSEHWDPTMTQSQLQSLSEAYKLPLQLGSNERLTVRHLEK